MKRMKAKAFFWGTLRILAFGLLIFSACFSPADDDGDGLFKIKGLMLSDHWSGTLDLNALSFQPGDQLTAEVQIRMPDRAWASVRDRVTSVRIAVVGERIYDKDGHPHRWSNTFGSTVLTSTGMPVETSQMVLPVSQLGHPYGSPVELVQALSSDQWESGFLNTRFTARMSLPIKSVPEGYYRLHTELFFEFDDGPLIPSNLLGIYLKGIPLSMTVADSAKMLLHIVQTQNHEQPVIRVGEPATPKMIWTLLTRQAIRGKRGIVAQEDRPYFALSNRFTFSGVLIAPKGTYDLTPDCPIDLSADYFEHGPLLSRGSNPFVLEPEDQIALTILTPSGKTIKQGPIPIHRLGKYGPMPKEPLLFEFDEYGQYQVRLTGSMTDCYGWRYDAGGTYCLWIAEPLTFSTSVKPGVPFLVGASFPNKLVVNPPVPATITYEIVHDPYSDAALRRRHVIEGQASPYGVFLSTAPQDRFSFERPGEYVSMLQVAYTDPEGRLFMGAQTSAGIVADNTGGTVAHGAKWLEPQPELSTVRASERFVSDQQGKHGDLHTNRFDCVPVPLPYHSGDVLFVAERLRGGGNISSELFVEAVDPAIRDAIFSFFPNGRADVLGYLYRGGSLSELPMEIQRSILQSSAYFGFALFDPDSMSDMLPLLSVTPKGFHPASFPEKRSIRSHFYLSAMRPGLMPQALIADSTAFASYWRMNSTTFDDQINAGQDGDRAGDIYRFHGGTVFLNPEKNLHSYSAYSSMSIVEAAGSYRNRVVAPFSEPLLRVNGRDLWSFMGLDPALIVNVGDLVPLAGLVFPTVETAVSFTVTLPDRTIVEVAGRSNSMGSFFTAGSLFRAQQAGVYTVKIHIDAGNGRSGGIVGKSDGTYRFYCVDPKSPSAMHVALHPVTSWDPEGDLIVPLRFAPGLTDARLTYSVEMPGILMDEGTIEIKGEQFVFRFSPRQFHRQFSNYDWPTTLLDQAESVDSVFLVFFFEAKDARGERITNATRVAIRKDMVFNLVAGDRQPPKPPAHKPESQIHE